jgi:hypothetical protein
MKPCHRATDGQVGATNQAPVESGRIYCAACCSRYALGLVPMRRLKKRQK